MMSSDPKPEGNPEGQLVTLSRVQGEQISQGSPGVP